ncbi:MAG: hypothetical protein ACJAT2_003119 [Bacteriovoracaceae bacterium]
MIYYCFYSLSILIIHHILISTAAFFHFQLDHSLGTIEDWIFEKAWEIIILTKLMCSWLILKFISIKSDSRNPVRDIFVRGFLIPEKETIVFVIFFILLIVGIGGPTKGHLVSLEFYKPLTSYWGLIIFYLCDVMVFNGLKSIHPFTRIEKWSAYVIFSSILYASSKGTFLYGLDISFNIYLIGFISFFLSDWKRSNWTLTAFFLITCIAPLGALLGFDPIWKASFTPLVLSRPISPINLSLIVIVSLGYFFYKNQRRFNRL